VFLIILFIQMIKYILLYLLHIIILHQSEVFVSGSVLRSKTIEPAVQTVLIGWTSTGLMSDRVLIIMTRTVRHCEHRILERQQATFIPSQAHRAQATQFHH